MPWGLVQAFFLFFPCVCCGCTYTSLCSGLMCDKEPRCSHALSRSMTCTFVSDCLYSRRAESKPLSPREQKCPQPATLADRLSEELPVPRQHPHPSLHLHTYICLGYTSLSLETALPGYFSLQTRHTYVCRPYLLLRAEADLPATARPPVTSPSAFLPLETRIRVDPYGRLLVLCGSSSCLGSPPTWIPRRIQIHTYYTSLLHACLSPLQVFRPSLCLARINLLRFLFLSLYLSPDHVYAPLSPQ